MKLKKKEKTQLIGNNKNMIQRQKEQERRRTARRQAKLRKGYSDEVKEGEGEWEQQEYDSKTKRTRKKKKKDKAIITNILSRLKSMKLSNKYQDLHETFNNEDYEIVEVDGKTTKRKKKKINKDGEYGGMNTGQVEWTEPRVTANDRRDSKLEKKAIITNVLSRLKSLNLLEKKKKKYKQSEHIKHKKQVDAVSDLEDIEQPEKKQFVSSQRRYGRNTGGSGDNLHSGQDKVGETKPSVGKRGWFNQEVRTNLKQRQRRARAGKEDKDVKMSKNQ